MSTALIVGAGPGLGYSMARRLGREGYRVALLSRRAERHRALVDQLAREGVEAVALGADVRDSAALAAAIDDVVRRLGDIDVVYYGPSPHGVTGPQQPITEVTGTDVEAAMSVVAAAADVVAKVLPSMVERKVGSFVFTSAISAVLPVPTLGAMTIPAAAARNYAITLNAALAAHDVYAGVLTIGGLIKGSDIEEALTAHPDQFGPADPALLLDPDRIADIGWDLITERRSPEAIVVPGRKRLALDAVLVGQILRTPKPNARPPRIGRRRRQAAADGLSTVAISIS